MAGALGGRASSCLCQLLCCAAPAEAASPEPWQGPRPTRPSLCLPRVPAWPQGWAMMLPKGRELEAMKVAFDYGYEQASAWADEQGY